MALERLLIVDGQLQFGATVADALASEGYEIVSAPDAATAVAMASTAILDALVTGTQVSPPTAPDLVSRLRARQPALPVLHIVDMHGDRAADRPWPPGVRTLRQPFTRTELVEAVRNLLTDGSPGRDLRDRLEVALRTRYRFERTLDTRGMSTVFVAEECELGRRVVVKVLPPQSVSTISAARFRLEIRLAARLQHPFIVPLFSAGVADGLLFYTMPFIEGEGLKERLAALGALPIEEAVCVLRNIAAALLHAHTSGIVHCDIKPANILLSCGEAVVTDFGIAKAIDVAAQHTGTTPPGIVFGTVAYMAPEQVAAYGTLDHRADLYAWGCVAYEILTGAPPFSGRSAMATLMAHGTEVPRAMLRSGRGVPPALAALVMQCLRKDPAERPASARELLQVLDTLGARRSGSVPIGPPPRDKGGALRRPGTAWARLRAVGRWLRRLPAAAAQHNQALSG